MEESLSKHRLDLAAELLADIELSRLPPEQLLLKATRLARLVDDDEIAQWLQFELRGYPTTDATATPHMTRSGRWTEPKEDKGYFQSLPEIEGHISTGEIQLQRLEVPNIHFAPSSSNPHEHVVGLFGQHVGAATAPVNTVLSRMTTLAKMVADLKGIRARVLAVLHDFVARTFHALAFSGLAESIFERRKVDVDKVFQSVEPELVRRIPAIYERLSGSDPEAISQALNSCRRLIHAFADVVYPPTPAMGEASEKGGASQHLNRIDAFVRAHCTSESRANRLRRSLRDVHERVSAGVHADVSGDEARSLFLLVYMTLGEIALLRGENV